VVAFDGTLSSHSAHGNQHLVEPAPEEYSQCIITSRYWPFEVRWAFVASLIMVPTLVALTIWLYRPDGPLAMRLTLAPLFIAVLLGLLPIALVILGGVRSVGAGGVTVAFTAVQDVVSTKGLITARSLIADNLGNPPGSVADSCSDTIIDSLKYAVGNHSVVVDLKEGDEWWETRLLVLVSGAARLSFPRAVVSLVRPPSPVSSWAGRRPETCCADCWCRSGSGQRLGSSAPRSSSHGPMTPRTGP
jgi:hypothetical protein